MSVMARMPRPETEAAKEEVATAVVVAKVVVTMAAEVRAVAVRAVMARAGVATEEAVKGARMKERPWERCYAQSAGRAEVRPVRKISLVIFLHVSSGSRPALKSTHTLSKNEKKSATLATMMKTKA